MPQSDTIVAVATPPGHGGIGVVRISGPEALSIAARLAARDVPFTPRHATLARIHHGGAPLDRAVITAFPGPHSYTGEDVAEISAHGSPVLLTAIVRAATALGARVAAPGEFTFRAYLNGRVDLVQAEAVQDLVEAVTPLQARAAFDQLEGTLTREIAELDRSLFDLCLRLEASLDFPAEGYHFIEGPQAASDIDRLAARIDLLLADAARGRLIREGAHVVLAGRPNSGKSSLFNRLAGAARAIVTDVPGTTRDLVSERIDLAGIPATLVDTAGIRTSPADAIEAEGIARASAARAVAGAVVVVLDGSAPLTEEDRELLVETAGAPRVVVANKADLGRAWEEADAGAGAIVRASALTGSGLDAVRAAIGSALQAREPRHDVPAVTNLRHAALLREAREALRRAGAAAGAQAPEEFVLADLNEARAALEAITGQRTPEAVLEAIFSSFCIGK